MAGHDDITNRNRGDFGSTGGQDVGTEEQAPGPLVRQEVPGVAGEDSQQALRKRDGGVEQEGRHAVAHLQEVHPRKTRGSKQKAQLAHGVLLEMKAGRPSVEAPGNVVRTEEPIGRDARVFTPPGFSAFRISRS